MLGSLLLLAGSDLEKPNSRLPVACSPDLPLNLVEVTVDTLDKTTPCLPTAEPQDDTTPLPPGPSPLGEVSINLDSPASEESERQLSGVEEPPPSPVGELPSLTKEVDDSAEGHLAALEEQLTEPSAEEQTMETTETNIKDASFQLTAEEIDLKEMEAKDSDSEESASATNEATIRLARQLSRGHQDSMSSSLGSPTEEQLPPFLQSNIEEQEMAVDDRIMSAWLPGMWVRGVLSSGRRVVPEQLARPGLITLTGKVSQWLPCQFGLYDPIGCGLDAA